MALPHVNVDQLREERYILGEKTLTGLLENCPKNQTIGDNLVRAWSKINSSKYEKIVCSISGGSDSDVMLDICTKCDKDNKIEYVWFDTGLEYQATKDHLKYLEEKYGIKIKPYKAIKPIPLSCKKYGQAADAEEAKRLYGLSFGRLEDIHDMDAVIIAVAHDEFKKLGKKELDGFFKAENAKKVLADIKGLLNRKDYLTEDYLYWRL